MKVLIAEDDAVSRLMLRRAIEHLGHEVLVATDGTDAWELYRQHVVDVIVSDWLMPGMDGLDLCRRVRAAQRETYTYFMLLTSLEGKQHFMQGMQAGADDYLTKRCTASSPRRPGSSKSPITPSPRAPAATR